VIIFINFIVIPGLIEVSIAFEDYQTRSDQNIVIVRRVFFFMILNTLLIPVTGTTTAVQLFERFRDAEGGIDMWPNLLSQNIMTQQYFYIKFII
jgi:hypothetical protein